MLPKKLGGGALFSIAVFLAAPLLLSFTLSYDEATSIVSSASDWRTILVRKYPNNHVLTSAAGYIANLGGHPSLMRYRLTNAAAGAATAAAMLATTGGTAGAAILAASSGWLVYSGVFRGYTLAGFLLLVAFIAIPRKWPTSSSGRVIPKELLPHIIMAANAFHIPSMLYGWASIAAIHAVRRFKAGQKVLLPMLTVLMVGALVSALAWIPAMAVTGAAVEGGQSQAAAILLHSPIHCVITGIKEFWGSGPLAQTRSGFHQAAAKTLKSIGDPRAFPIVFPLLTALLLSGSAEPLAAAAAGYICFLAVGKFPPARSLVPYHPLAAAFLGEAIARRGWKINVPNWTPGAVLLLLALLVSLLGLVVPLQTCWEATPVEGWDTLKALMPSFCVNPWKVDGEGILNQALVIAEEEVCGRRLSISEIRKRIRNRKVSRNAILWLVRQSGLHVEEALSSGWFPIVSDGELAILGRKASPIISP